MSAFWALVATWAVRNFDWLLSRAIHTPYTHIMSPDGKEVYMFRYWLFNPYPPQNDGRGRRWGDWLPSIRLHRIMRPDGDRHLHDHPWNARTIILRGWYEEERYAPWWESSAERESWAQAHPLPPRDLHRETLRKQGYTGRLLFGEFHRITRVSAGGVWTLFLTWKYRGTWGFDVDGVKVPWRKYLAGRDE